MFIKDTQSATKLKSHVNNDNYLDSINPPEVQPGTSRKKKPPLSKKNIPEIEDDTDTE
jgi:hypothetical protein